MFDRFTSTGAAGAMMVAAYFGISPPVFIEATAVLAFGLAAASFFPATILDIFNKRTPREGAVSCMPLGILVIFGDMAVYNLGRFMDEALPRFEKDLPLRVHLKLISEAF